METCRKGILAARVPSPFVKILPPKEGNDLVCPPPGPALQGPLLWNSRHARIAKRQVCENPVPKEIIDALLSSSNQWKPKAVSETGSVPRNSIGGTAPPFRQSLEKRTLRPSYWKLDQTLTAQGIQKDRSADFLRVPRVTLWHCGLFQQIDDFKSSEKSKTDRGVPIVDGRIPLGALIYLSDWRGGMHVDSAME